MPPARLAGVRADLVAVGAAAQIADPTATSTDHSNDAARDSATN